jgi:ribosomal protein S18 acetylase RimI-like enzyme
METIVKETKDMENLLFTLFRQAEDYFFRGVSIHCLDREGVTAYMTGVPVKSLNLAYVRQGAALKEETLGQINQFYAHQNLPFELVVPKDLCVPSVEDRLKMLGYGETDASGCMAIRLSYRSASSFDEEVIIQANNANLNDWMVPLVEAFESTLGITAQYTLSHERALEKGVTLYHFSLYHKDQPVSSLTLSVQGTVARIDDVGTLPEFQGKGYATHLVTYALAEAANQGVVHCFLESSVSGLPIYEKIGFKPLFQNRIYAF